MKEILALSEERKRELAVRIAVEVVKGAPDVSLERVALDVLGGGGFDSDRDAIVRILIREVAGSICASLPKPDGDIMKIALELGPPAYRERTLRVKEE